MFFYLLQVIALILTWSVSILPQSIKGPCPSSAQHPICLFKFKRITLSIWWAGFFVKGNAYTRRLPCFLRKQDLCWRPSGNQMLRLLRPMRFDERQNRESFNNYYSWSHGHTVGRAVIVFKGHVWLPVCLSTSLCGRPAPKASSEQGSSGDKKERPMSTMSEASNYTGGSDYSTFPGSPATTVNTNTTTTSTSSTRVSFYPYGL